MPPLPVMGTKSLHPRLVSIPGRSVPGLPYVRHGRTAAMLRCVSTPCLTLGEARTAFYATGLISYFYILTFFIGSGAMVLVGQDVIAA